MPAPEKFMPSDSAAFINENFAFAERQYAYLLRNVTAPDKFPHTVEHGKLVVIPPENWASGFFPGALWLIYEHTRAPRWKRAALDYTRRLDPVRRLTNTHDIGFMLHCSHGRALSQATRPRDRAAHCDILVDGARNLANRFNPAVRAIRSWDFGTHRWHYPVIIDNMMNLELLLWASRETGDPRYREIAIGHAHKTLAHHFREDGSCFHVVDYDPDEGTPIVRETSQGYANWSAWARGQAWALYGFTMMFRETRNPAYLRQAHTTARFIRTHTRLPADKIPFWDFDAPCVPNLPRDASSGAIIASALIELSTFSEPKPAQVYLELAQRQLASLSSPDYRAALGENGGFILKHSTGNHNMGGEVDAPINYADYYFLEALLRLKNL